MYIVTQEDRDDSMHDMYWEDMEAEITERELEELIEHQEVMSRVMQIAYAEMQALAQRL